MNTAPDKSDGAADSPLEADDRFDTNRQLEAALQASHVTVFEQDRSLRYTWIHNPALGHSVADVIGKRDRELFQRAEDGQRIESIKRSVVESGVGRRHEVPVFHDGAVHWYDLSVQARRDAAGAITGVTCAAVEVTARRQRESHLRLLGELDRAFAPNATIEEIARESARRLADHLNLSRCLMVEADIVAGEARVFHDSSPSGTTSLVGRYALHDFHTPQELQALTAGRLFVIDDVAGTPRTPEAAARFRELGIAALVNAPHASEGGCRFVLSATRDAACHWMPAETWLLQEAATRTFLRIDRKRADDRLAAARDTFEHLVRHSPFGIYVVDADFRLALVSQGARKVFENVEPSIGRDFAEVVRAVWSEPFASEVIGRFVRTLTTGEPYQAASSLEQRQDITATEAYDWKVERVTMPDGRLGVVCHFYDLSARERKESALREVEQQRSDFLAMLAHELRNPLAPMRTAVALMRSAPEDAGALRHCRDVIGRQVDHLSRLLDDLLDLARLTRTRFVLQRSTVRLADTLDAALEINQPWIEAKGSRVQVENNLPDLSLDADGARLIQVFANLLNNAIKYSPPHGRITVLVGRDDASVTVRVCDNGVGMSAALLAQVFDLYARGDNAHRQSPDGLGIGLALARHLVELHGGRITAVSEGEGMGSEFTVTLPLPAIVAAVPEESARGADDRLSCRVLVVDDNTDAADTTGMLLGAYGADVQTAYDGASALETAEQFRPDVVLLDLGLPGADGYAVCRQLRRAPWAQGIAILALSGWAQDDHVRRGQAAGFDGHLVKPVDPERLLQVIAEALARTEPQPLR